MFIGKASLSHGCSVDVRIPRKKRGRQDFCASTEHCKVRYDRWQVSDLTDYVGCTSRPEDSEAVWAPGAMLGKLYG